jgi:hypothetical protein
MSNPQEKADQTTASNSISNNTNIAQNTQSAQNAQNTQNADDPLRFVLL